MHAVSIRRGLRARTAAAFLVVTVASLVNVTAAEPLGDQGFGPPIRDDYTLNANLHTLHQMVAWQNWWLSEPFAVARLSVGDQDFTQLAMLH